MAISVPAYSPRDCRMMPRDKCPQTMAKTENGIDAIRQHIIGKDTIPEIRLSTARAEVRLAYRA
ncbi:MAG: hypothetical protein Fues2KO_45870 [Fuerstiella sp.]